MVTTGAKRKRQGAQIVSNDAVFKPTTGTKTYHSGKDVKQGLALGTRQAFTAFHQQILTSQSILPLTISHPTTVIIQHYLDVSPNLDEIFNAWRNADATRDDQLVQASVSLLVHVLQILAGIPFFRSTVLGIAKKVINPSEPFGDLLNRMIQSAKRDHILHGLNLAATIVNLDKPDVSASSSSGSGRLATKMWSVLVEGGSVKGLAKMMIMRRRNKEGNAEYGNRDPLDRPDIRHLIIHLILPLLATPGFQAQSKPILPALYNNIQQDPPITILRLIPAIHSAVSSQSPGMARRTALALLDENAIEKFVDLLSREDKDVTTGLGVGEMVSRFLEDMTTVPGRGVCFPDEGWYARRKTGEGGAGALDGNVEEDEDDDRRGFEEGGNGRGKGRRGLHNRILSNVIRRLGGKVMEDTGRVGEWVVKVLAACPEIVAGYWPNSALSLEPRLSSRWLATMSFVGRIISLPPPSLATFHLPLPRGVHDDSFTSPPRSNPPSTTTMIESILPSPLTKSHLTKGLQHADTLVQHITALSLSRALQKLGTVQAILRQLADQASAEPGPSSENAWTKRSRELEMEVRKRVPEVLVIIAFAQKSATLARLPADSEDEPDPVLVAKSSILTESALRLFRLYHRNLPTLSNEARFDVGKLLVSSSSAKSERREKREGREGSVISDTGSVGSVGTVGTVGMGGGFGSSRGEVEGFEALSQVHVLRLLEEVRGWNWINKAAGSQFTYFYHILLLHLNTPHQVTSTMTTHLLHRLLTQSILFSHDPSELPIWLNSLPSQSTDPNTTLEQRALFTIQQINLLSFLDDVVRRVMKTPYKYIEENLLIKGGEGYFEVAKPWGMISPMMSCVIEQFRAKLLGELISTEAAGVVLGYLRRVVCGLGGKMRGGRWLEGVVECLEGVVRDAREKGQARVGLDGVLRGMKGDLRKVFGGEAVGEVGNDEVGMKMIDDEEWKKRSFEIALLDNKAEDWSVGRFKSFFENAEDGVLARLATLAVHFLVSQPGGRSVSLGLLKIALENIQGVEGSRVKEWIFGVKVVKGLMIKDEGDQYRDLLEEVVSTLSIESGEDQAIAQVYIHKLIEKLGKDKKGKKLLHILTMLKPWTRFLEPPQAQDILSMIAKHVDRLQEPTEAVKETLSDLLRGSKDVEVALKNLEAFATLGTIPAYIDLLRSSADTSTGSAKVDVNAGSIAQLLNLGEEEGQASAYDLISAILEIPPAAIKAFSQIMGNDEKLLEKSGLLGATGSVLDLPGALSPAVSREAIADTAIRALCDKQSSRGLISTGLGVVQTIAHLDSPALFQAVQKVKYEQYNSNLANAALTISKDCTREAVPILKYLLEIGLQWAVRALSSDGELHENSFSCLASLRLAVSTGVEDLELNVNLVEPVITAVVQDRLDSMQALQFASSLITRTSLKASFVRQTLQTLLSSPTHLSHSSSTPLPTRSAYINLYTTLFLSSPYITSQNPSFIEALLPLYHATLSTSDKSILRCLKTWESWRRVSVGGLLKFWNVSGMVVGQKGLDGLKSLDAGRVWRSCVGFPLRRGLVEGVKERSDALDNMGDGSMEGGDELYDPVFVLQLFVGVLLDGENERLSGLDWVEILRSNVLGLAVCGLSSRDGGVRGLSAWCLKKTMEIISVTPFHERDQLLYTLRILKHSIVSSPETPERQPRLPVLSTQFIAQTIRSLSTPSHHLHPTASRFILTRPVLDITDVPMLYNMLYAGGDGWRGERKWIVGFMGDACRSAADWRILKRRYSWDLLATLFGSSLDPIFRKQVLQTLEKMTRIPQACASLVHRSLLLEWISAQWGLGVANKVRGGGEERGLFLGVLENVLVGMSGRARGGVNGERKGGIESVVDRGGDVVMGDGREEPGKGRDERGVGAVDLERRVDWLGPAERIILQAVQGADLARLEILARLVLRISTISPISARDMFAPLVERLHEIKGEKKDQTKVVETLFEVGLAFDGLRLDGRVGEAVKEVGGLALEMEGDVGGWVRREKRRAVWEKFNGEK